MEDKGIKIGARVLDNDTLKILIPDYESIFLEIDKIRNSINNENDEIKRTDEEFFKHHNNVFSILGERGAGKTSVQLTLKYKLLKEKLKKGDKVLPMIVPQDMDDDSSVIGWIIAHFSNIMKELLKEEKFYLYEEEKDKRKELKNYFEELKKSFFLRQESYKSSLSVEDTIYNYVQRNEEVIRENIDLSKKFKAFIDIFIEFRKNIENLNPLIFIFFDDVDISNKRCLMVLETLLRYLSHSNIVVFVAGDYLTFKETITLSYLKEDGLLDKDLMKQKFEKKSALEIRQILAYDYLKKVLSPALRYELKTLSLENKKNFKCKQDSLSLEELFKEKIKFLDSFYEILDSKPRGLINVYYFLKNINGSMNNDELRRFIAIIINSSSDLNIKKEEIEAVIEFNPNIDINFSKFDKEDYSTVNLKILLLILFSRGEINFKEHEKEVLEYFKNYLNDKIEIIGELGRKIDIFDIFLEEKDISDNIDLFYNLLVKFEGKKITQGKFYQKYFSEILKISENNHNLDLNKYYTTHLYLNKDKIRKIIEGLKKVNNTLEMNLALEMELRFKNLYLLDEVRESSKNKIKNKGNIRLNTLKKRYVDILPLSEQRINQFKKIRISILNNRTLKHSNSNIYRFQQVINKTDLNISEKIVILTEGMEQIKLIIIDIYEYIQKNSEIIKEVFKNQISDKTDYSNNNTNSFLEVNKNGINNFEYIFEIRALLIEKYQILPFNLEDIILRLKSIDNYKKLLSEISLILGELKILENKILSNRFENLEKELEKISQNIDENLITIFRKEILEERKEIETEILKHLSAQNLLNKFIRKSNQKIYNRSLKETLDKIEEIYKKIEYYEMFDNLESETEALEIVSDRLLDLEENFIKNKIIFEVKNIRVLEILKEEGLMEFEGYLNNENYANSRELQERYDLFFNRDGRINLLEGRNVVRDYIRKELSNYNTNLLITERIDLENLIELFMDIYRGIEKSKIDNQNSTEIESHKLEMLYKSLSQEPLLKRYFK